MYVILYLLLSRLSLISCPPYFLLFSLLFPSPPAGPPASKAWAAAAAAEFAVCGDRAEGHAGGARREAKTFITFHRQASLPSSPSGPRPASL